MSDRVRGHRTRVRGRLAGTFVAGAGVAVCLLRIEPTEDDAWVGVLLLGRSAFAIRGRYLPSRRAGYGFLLAPLDRRPLARLCLRPHRAGITLQVDAEHSSTTLPEAGAPARIRLERPAVRARGGGRRGGH
ncbi:MAG: hypothetical protein H0U69_13300 [Trueperaceae bacterium]|nr:hypothetical protein [Trueperaceae bacterium]